MSEDENKGLIDATNRIVSVLLRKPAFRNSLRSLLNSIDSENSRDLARTVLWQDPELALSLVGAVPSLANAAIRFLDQVVIEVMEKFPPELIHEFIEALLQDIDRDAAKRAAGNFSMLFREAYVKYQADDAGKGEENE